jgi:hypothetical protein
MIIGSFAPGDLQLLNLALQILVLLPADLQVPDFEGILVDQFRMLLLVR